MDKAITDMLSEYDCKTKFDYSNALKEIIQEVSLLGLWRSKFYEYAAFYGGTSLRILYGLNRFSEDMDFTLIKPDSKFDLSPHLKAIEEELLAFGFEVNVEKKKKKMKSQIESAFVKSDTKIQFIKIKAPDSIVQHTLSNEILKIKIEVDTDPPMNFKTEMKNLLRPIPFQVKTMTLDCLFAGKLHAILARKWKTRVKGRDYYDLIWYIGQKVQPNLEHLKSRLVQSGDWPSDKNFTKKELKKLLTEKFKTVNFDDAKKDVAPFLKSREQQSLTLWNQKYFLNICSHLF
ncbi:MAG: nucleotidyl transferase AbiEii/AbiGii toxin family protein [Bdellovibrionales bacterium]|nr:nucleotidyl transferase AbiEii/AbiGii toxin family protein [Bdellovibrionales bacterium]